MRSPEEIINLFNQIEIDNLWSFGEYKPSQTGKWTHSYHRYPAKFIPQLVEKLIEEYISTPDAHLNDPFMGCGTTIVTSIAQGFHASGTDINRIAHLVTKVKATPIAPEYLAGKITRLFNVLHTLQDGKGVRVEPSIPKRHWDKIKYWFTEEMIDRLGTLLSIIYSEEDPSIRDFLLVAFSHILKSGSLWLQGSTKPVRDPHKKVTDPWITFCKHVRKMQKGNAAFYQVVPPNVREHLNEYLNIKLGDARSQPVKDATVDLVVSSSPYVTSYEYADVHQLSTIWLDLVDDLKSYRREFIGTSSKSSCNCSLQSAIAKDIVEKMMEQDGKKAQEVKTFFADMQAVFDESFRILKPGGRCCYVIGNTQLRGVHILNAEVFAESLQYSGFSFARVIKREIPSKILPQKRDKKTGRFAKNHEADSEAYPTEYIVIGFKG